MAMVIARAWKDPSFKARLIAHPNEVIEEEGYSIPAGVRFVVLENTRTVRYLPLKRNLDLTKDLKELKFVLGNLLPIQPGHEIRLVQSTENIRYAVLPATPENVDVDAATQKDLFGYAAAEGATFSVTDVATVQTVATLTTEVTGAEVGAEVVAVAVAVAT